MPPPNPTPILRIIHIDNLRTLIQRGGLHATNHTPNDGLPYRTIHNVDIQNVRHIKPIRCGPGGTMHDYLPFYFGYLSPMLFQLKTGRVPGYAEGQEPLIYLQSSVQAVQSAGIPFVFSNGHGIAAFTAWFDDLARLEEVDWEMVNQRYWLDNINDMDRQRRKQAEFLIHQFCPWTLIEEITVVNATAKDRVESVMDQFDVVQRKLVKINSGWYYY
jgi:hypothetical protein